MCPYEISDDKENKSDPVSETEMLSDNDKRVDVENTDNHKSDSNEAVGENEGSSIAIQDPTEHYTRVTRAMTRQKDS